MGKYFGTDGFRGTAGTTLTIRQVYMIGRFLGMYSSSGVPHNNANILIGKDTRISSTPLENALVAGITESKSNVYLMGVTTTPSMSYILNKNNFDYGVMITASHNPFMDNGIKILDRTGEKISELCVRNIEEFLDTADINALKCTGFGTVNDYHHGVIEYIDHLVKQSDCTFENLNIAIDCANGSASFIAPEVFRRLGINAHIINSNPNGKNINNECGSTCISELRAYVIDNHLKAGFAFDGDADRCIAIDEEGNEIDGDGIIYICAKYLNSHGMLPNKGIVATYMSNFGVIKSLLKCGIANHLTEVGDKNVYECMKSLGIVLGGEQSGHIIFADRAKTGDGILTAIMLINIMEKEKKTLHELMEGCEPAIQLSNSVRVKNKYAIFDCEKFEKVVAECEEDVKGKGRIYIRMSGTEPKIRIMVEADNDLKALGYLVRLSKTVKECDDQLEIMSIAQTYENNNNPISN